MNGLTPAFLSNHDRRVHREAFPQSLSRVRGGCCAGPSCRHQSMEATMGSEPVKAGEFRLEVVLIPVSDVDRARASTILSAGDSTPTSPRTTTTGWCR